MHIIDRYCNRLLFTFYLYLISLQQKGSYFGGFSQLIGLLISGH